MSGPQVEQFRKPDWSPLPHEGCVGVESRVIVWEPELGLALLRFGERATIHEHPGENDTLVACLEGEGFTSVAGETAPLSAGQRVFWPAGVSHRLWTDGAAMTTLMVERQRYRRD